jgi:copper chaperone
MSSTATYRVEGMTCDHCVRAVRDEVSQVPGVVDVDVDLAGHSVTVTGDVDASAVRAAVASAGFEVPE